VELIKKSSRLYWQILGILLIGLLLYMLVPFLDVILYGVFVYYVTRPIYERIEDRIKKRSISAFISLFLFILPVIMIAIYAFSIASFELTRFMERIDYTIHLGYLNKAIEELSSIGRQLTPQELWEFIKENPSIQDILILPVASLVDILFKLFLMFTIAFYLLKDGYRLRGWVSEKVLGGDAKLSDRFFNSIDEDLNRVFFGNILVALFTALIAIALFYILNLFAPQYLGIPYPFLLGILCGIAIFIPGIGIKIVWVPMALYLVIQAYVNNVLFTGWWFILVFLISVFFLVDLSPDIVLRPYISAKRVHPGVMLIAYLFGYIVFGFMGLFLGPIIVILVTNFMNIILPEIRR